MKAVSTTKPSWMKKAGSCPKTSLSMRIVVFKGMNKRE
jgi:hypothetical protein